MDYESNAAMLAQRIPNENNHINKFESLNDLMKRTGIELKMAIHPTRNSLFCNVGIPTFLRKLCQIISLFNIQGHRPPSSCRFHMATTLGRSHEPRHCWSKCRMLERGRDD